MIGFFTSLGIIESLFLYSGIVGSLFFVLRFITLIMGFSSSGQSDAIEANDASGSLLQDLDGNGVPDILEADGLSGVDSLADLDGNGIPDALESGDLSDVTSIQDLDGDGIPDSLETHVDPGSNKLTEVISSDSVQVKKGAKLIEFSVQNICAFFMVFGLIGFGLIHFNNISIIISFIIAFICGTITAFVFTKSTQAMMKLGTSGNKKITSAIGRIGTVYLRIPAEGTGQIQVNVSGRLEVCDAESADKTEIPSGEEVQVVKVKKGNILCVTKNINKSLASNL